jgi:hypothetical protein
VIRRSFPLTLLLFFSLFSSLATTLPPISRGQARPASRPLARKMTDDLTSLAQGARRGGGEKARVIVRVAEGAAGQRARLALQSAGAGVRPNREAGTCGSAPCLLS